MSVETIPILPSWDFDQTVGFFAPLGFVEQGRWPDSYLILRHDKGIELHFFASRRFKPKTNDHGTYVRFPTAGDVDALHTSWSRVDLAEGVLTDPEDADYGLREFALLDPMRNLLRVGGFISAV